MKKIIIILLVVVLIVASFFIGHSLNKIESSSLEIQNLKNQIDSLQQQNIQLQDQNNQLSKQLGELQKKIEKKESDTQDNIIYLKNPPELAEFESPDNLLIDSSKDNYFRNKDFIFSGRIIELDEDIKIGEDWDKRKKYDIEADEVYLNLFDFPTQNIKSEIVGWIPPKNGRLYFWGEYQEDYITSYISAEPREIWFEPTSGKYEIKITKLEKESTECTSIECIDYYKASGEVLNTKQGLIQDGKSIQFKCKNPTFEKDSSHIFIGTITDTVENTFLKFYK